MIHKKLISLLVLLMAAVSGAWAQTKTWESLAVGDVIKVSDLEIAKNDKIEITTHMDSVVASVLAPKNAEPEAEAAEDTEAKA